MNEAAPTGIRTPLGRYVALLAVAGMGTAVAWAARATGEELDVLRLGVLTSLGLLAVLLPVRVHRRSGIQAFTLEEGVFLAMLFTLPAGVVPALMVGVSLVGHIVARRAPVKVLFNAGQVGIWATVSTVTFHALVGTPDVMNTRAWVAAVATTLVLNIVSLVLVGELFRRLEGRRYRETIQETLRVNVVTWIGNTVYGLVLVILVDVHPAAPVLASLLMIGQFLGFRGYAGAVQDQRRSEQLHAVSHLLADAAPDGDVGVRFLQYLSEMFGARGAHLVRLEDGGRRYLHFDAVEGRVAAEHVASAALDETVTRGAPYLSAGSANVAGVGVATMAAPMTIEGRTVGGLVLAGRIGLEPWGRADVSLLAALANEAAVGLRNAELFAEVQAERRRLAEESEKLNDILATASDGIVMLAPDGTVAVWNPAMTEITGATADESSGVPWYQAMRLRDAETRDLVPGQPSVFSAALETGGAIEDLDLQILRRDGAWRWLRCSLAAVRHDTEEPAGVVMVVRDVTRQHEIQELKADFTATVSHELRTPLTPLRGFIDTLEARGDELQSGQRAEMLRAMQGQVARLEGLVGDLLAVAAADRGLLGLSTEPVDVVRIIHEVVAGGALQHHRDRLDIDAPDWLGVAADPKGVARVLSALVENAVKHTEGPVRVRVLERDDAIDVEVQDEGPGIPPWDQERIFERFTRLGDHLRRTQGPGLGLAIARAYAEELGGEVTVRSDVATGSVFTLRLRRANARSVQPDRADEVLAEAAG